jgi:hypothetical protein
MRKPPVVASLAVAAALSLAASLAPAAERGEAKLTLAGKTVVIDYGRPALAGRDMLSRLLPGQPWRLGADDETTLTTEADLMFGSVAVPKGRYVLQAKRGADGKWTLLASADGKDIEVPLADQQLSSSVELFTIELSGKGNGGQLFTKWQTLQLSAPFTAK